tara:strand:+ start:461 stop:871 length:411 start_codon:yes stop_codon:yes gene_type:complete
MATRSVIAKLDDKGVQAIYCHNDGYLSNNGKILDQHYANEVKVDNLIAQGDCSSLKDTIEDTIFYHRDKGDCYEGVKAVNLNNETKLLEHAFETCDAELVYMFAYGSWYVYDNANTIGNCSYHYIELEEALYNIPV